MNKHNFIIRYFLQNEAPQSPRQLLILAIAGGILNLTLGLSTYYGVCYLISRQEISFPTFLVAASFPVAFLHLFFRWRYKRKQS